MRQVLALFKNIHREHIMFSDARLLIELPYQLMYAQQARDAKPTFALLLDLGVPALRYSCEKNIIENDSLQTRNIPNKSAQLFLLAFRRVGFRVALSMNG